MAHIPGSTTPQPCWSHRHINIYMSMVGALVLSTVRTNYRAVFSDENAAS